MKLGKVVVLGTLLFLMNVTSGYGRTPNEMFHANKNCSPFITIFISWYPLSGVAENIKKLLCLIQRQLKLKSTNNCPIDLKSFTILRDGQSGERVNDLITSR